MPIELFEMLQEDHEKIKSILDDLTETTEDALKTRETQFRKLQEELLPHMRGEEQALYPKLKALKETKELALEALEQHHAAEMVLTELNALALDDEVWSAKLKVFQEMLEHHIEEEEGEVFDRAEEVMDEKQLQDIMQQIMRVKEEYKVTV